jgi:hypothetical protein
MVCIQNWEKNECFVVQTGITERIIASNHPELISTQVRSGSKSNEEDPCLAERDLPIHVPATQNIQNTTRECA